MSFPCKAGALRGFGLSWIFLLRIVKGPICLDTQGLHVAPHHSFQPLLPSHLKPSEPEKSKPLRDPKLIHKSQLHSVIFSSCLNRS